MELFDYIKSQLPQMPNTVIMKQLGASQELIDYVKETPENTNLGMLFTYGCEPGGDDNTVTVTFVDPLGDNWSADEPSSYEIYQMETANPLTVTKGTTITLPPVRSSIWRENSSEGTQYASGTEFTVNADVIFGAEPSE